MKSSAKGFPIQTLSMVLQVKPGRKTLAIAYSLRCLNQKQVEMVQLTFPHAHRSPCRSTEEIYNHFMSLDRSTFDRITIGRSQIKGQLSIRSCAVDGPAFSGTRQVVTSLTHGINLSFERWHRLDRPPRGAGSNSLIKSWPSHTKPGIFPPRLASRVLC